MTGGAPGAGNFGATARAIVQILKPHTPFAEAIVRRQVERAGLSATTLVESDLPKVLPLIIAAAHTFVDPEVIAQLKLLAK
jgi:hypothetical protein